MPSWRPPFAPHVRGDHPDRTFDEDGAPEPAAVALRCERSGDRAEVRCASGRFRQRIAQYALAHARCGGRGKIES